MVVNMSNGIRAEYEKEMSKKHSINSMDTDYLTMPTWD